MVLCGSSICSRYGSLILLVPQIVILTHSTLSSISPLSVIADDENDRNKPHNSNHPKQRYHQWIKRTGSSPCTSGRRGIGR